LIVKRQESWGEIIYNTLEHRFSIFKTNGIDAIPYVKEPILLNVYLTLKCNMDCQHCVSKDFDELVDLEISKKLLDWINNSKFLVIVITGGEPLLPEYESQLKALLTGIHGKGLIIDTNGTNIPSDSIIETIRNTNTLVRISWDGVQPEADTYFRIFNSKLKSTDEVNIAYSNKKLKLIPYLQKAGVNIAVQTVISSSGRARIRNESQLIKKMPETLNEYSINKWYLQKFIPSYQRKDIKYTVNKTDYEDFTIKLKNECKKYNIDCITKKDIRHNCVVMLVGKGVLYTQGQKPGQKIKLGTIDDPKIDYSKYMSIADHAERYYE